MECTLTRAFAFHARHRYFRSDWSVEENQRRFGWTSEWPGHGHLYRIEVSVAGPMQRETSMIIDLGVLDQLLETEIIAPLSGQHLNEAIPAFAAGSELPTCEALATWCWHRLADRLPDPVRLVRIRVAEDESLWAECAEPSAAPRNSADLPAT